jgi:serine/threonine protein kinase
MAEQGHRRFELRSELGRGGMGVVYEALDTERNEFVALKMLHRCDPEVIASLKHEFRSLSEIAHPRLISMYELLNEGDEWFFTMELLRGAQNLMEHASSTEMSRQFPHTLPPTSPNTTASLAETTLGLREAATVEELSTIDQSASAEDQATGIFDGGPATLVHTTPEVMAELPRSLVGGIPNRSVPVRGDLTEEDGVRITSIFRQLAEGVHALHQLGKLHRDLKPGNVVVRQDGSLVILDFGLAISGTRKATPTQEDAEKPKSGGLISGTIPYMSPEQAAGSPLTEASDWYAVGTMLFEALSGTLPFNGDARSILRAKIATPAPELSLAQQQSPEAVTNLVAIANALLERNPVRRPSGMEVLQRLGASDAAAFPIAEEATLFVGRRNLLQQLEQSLKDSAQRAVLVQVHGRSGSGKTALMEQFLSTLPPAPATLVLRGRCYEQESVPYKTLDGLSDAIASWITSLPVAEQRALTPPHAYALSRIFPVFLRVGAIGEAATRAKDDAIELTELRRRAFQAFADLLERIGRAHTTVLCIDDLQWGDADGMTMLETALGRSDLRAMLLVTYRDEYLPSSAALRAMTDLLQRLPSLLVQEIPVAPLTREESLALLRELLSESGMPPPAALEAMLDQASGNPYFLAELARRGGQRTGADGTTSSALGLDDVLWGRIGNLPLPELHLLETVAISGQPIRLREAQVASGLQEMPPSVLTSLRMHRLVRSNGLGIASEIQTYHDRVRETVLAHIAAERQTKLHLDLGLCLESAGYETPDTLAVHFELGDRAEHASGYYEKAASNAVDALAFGRAEDLFKKAGELTGDARAKLRIAERLVHLLSNLARFPEAYATGRRALATLGVNIPARFSPPSFLLELARNWKLLRKRTPDQISALPASDDPDHRARTQMLAAVGKAAYQMRPELCIAILLKLVNACMRRGNTPDAAIGYMAVGSIFFGGILGRHESGYRYGQVSLDLVQRYDASRIRAEVNFVVGYFGISWRRPAQEAEELWMTSRAAGLATGDLFHVGCASCATVMSHWMRGLPLETLDASSAELLQVVTKYNLREPRFAIQSVRRSLLALRDGEESLPDPEDPPTQLDQFGSRHFAHFCVLLELQRHFLFGRYRQAMDAAKSCRGLQADSRGMLHSAEYLFYSELARLAGAGTASPLSRRRTISRAARSVRRLETWALGSPTNFKAKSLLLRAEWNAAKGRQEIALQNFHESADAALCYSQPHIAAIAFQRASIHAGKNGEPAEARNLLQQSETLYRSWGARAYADRLRDASPGL